jgi:hypothetical protein
LSLPYVPNISTKSDDIREAERILHDKELNIFNKVS